MLDNLVDIRNQNLWNELKDSFQMSFQESSNRYYGVHSINNDVTFFVPATNLCPDSFTHELLHVYLRHKKCFVGAALTLTIQRSKVLSSILSPDLVEHMGNCLDHLKMLPIYLRMGFDRTKFIIDYSERKSSAEQISLIKLNYKIGKKVNKQAVDQYVGRYFSIIADPNSSYDYTNDLSVLQKIDPLLFSILQKTIEKWGIVDIESDDPLKNDYHTVLSDYYENMKKWINKHEFI